MNKSTRKLEIVALLPTPHLLFLPLNTDKLIKKKDMFRSTAAVLNRANAVVARRFVPVNAYSVFIQQVWNTKRFPTLLKTLKKMPFVARGKALAAAYKKLPKSELAALKAAAAATKPRAAVTKKAKWMKSVSNTKEFKGLKPAAKLDAMASKWNSMLARKRKVAARKTTKKNKKVAKRK